MVGPDGYPDVVMGQGIIHPGDDPTTSADEGSTGKWLRWVLNKAWAAQVDSATYPDDNDRLEILAFAYGFLTHAAGDMWAHTLVNDFSQGVFPPVADIPTDPQKLKIALRHIIIEGYIGDATPATTATRTAPLCRGEAVNDALGIDIDQLQELLKNPATYLDAGLPSPPFPPGLLLFNFGDHERLDRIMGLPDPGPLGDHHAGSDHIDSLALTALRVDTVAFQQ